VAKMLSIKLVRSTIGRPENQRVTVKTLGLRKMHRTVVHQDSPGIRGMIAKVSHLVEVSEVDSE